MRDFADMFQAVDGSTKTTVKTQSLKKYFDKADAKDKVWAIAIMSHRRPKRPMTTTLLREWAAEYAEIPLWLFEDSYHIAGDLAETITLLCHSRESDIEDSRSLDDFMKFIISMKAMDTEAQRVLVQETWRTLDYTSCFIFNKLLTGNFRMGVSQKLMQRSLSLSVGIEENVIAHKLMGDWDPASIDFQELILDIQPENMASKPYPFYLAYSMPGNSKELGNSEDWQVEWKWDGIRGQVILRDAHLYVWTRGEELVTDRYPEFSSFTDSLPDGTVLDGEIMAFKDGMPLDFQALQKRIGRKSISNKLMEEIPVVFMAYDLLEHQGEDIRELPMAERRALLEVIVKEVNNENLLVSPLVNFKAWADLDSLIETAREKRCEGFMLKHKQSAYEVGRKKGNWWKWKVDPYSIDAVLTFAMRGHGRRANLYTDYTFGLWQDGELITFAKAYSGLSDKEFNQVDSFVRKNTVQRFGPVRQVKPELVFELAFEGIAVSSRHKSGVAVRFPRMVRWRTDKKANEANSLSDLIELIPEDGRNQDG